MANINLALPHPLLCATVTRQGYANNLAPLPQDDVASLPTNATVGAALS